MVLSTVRTLVIILEFTPLEFETELGSNFVPNVNILEFTPLEFETPCKCGKGYLQRRLEFTPLEFETLKRSL